MFMKGIELDKDLKCGETGTVLKEFEQSERIRQAIQSGAIEEVGGENTKVGTSVIHTPFEPDFTSLIGKTVAGPGEIADARREGKAPEQAQEENLNTVEGQLEKFNRLNGKAKLNFAKELTNLAAVRQALATIGKGKVKAALEARLIELQPRSLSLEAIPTEDRLENPNKPESM